MDEIVGHMRERIELPDSYEGLSVPRRKQPDTAPEKYLAYADTDGSMVPAMADFGSGYRWHVTGLVHDETGFPKGTPAATKNSQDRLHLKLRDHEDDIVQVENYRTDDADVVVIAYGGAARTAYDAVDMARDEGIRAGLLRPVTIWPFADREIQAAARNTKCLLVHELNCGQYVREVGRAVHGIVPVHLYAKYDNEPATPEQLLEKIRESAETIKGAK